MPEDLSPQTAQSTNVCLLVRYDGDGAEEEPSDDVELSKDEVEFHLVSGAEPCTIIPPLRFKLSLFSDSFGNVIGNKVPIFIDMMSRIWKVKKFYELTVGFQVILCTFEV